ncbi:hypothetical protein K443DRAFT_572065 [Laccaria amethystina LaAM-08-1]|uniref:Uncharacterized protein n=1 Tax=Laccaria amethystina LaAM-08-1 TaxID=1095629 RepID=A0A0C9XUF1_9AGAR|nr:hypothetical protein K443DRAFT_572065 [Laccaria amethystina LaAM-08-1]
MRRASLVIVAARKEPRHYFLQLKTCSTISQRVKSPNQEVCFRGNPYLHPFATLENGCRHCAFVRPGDGKTFFHGPDFEEIKKSSRKNAEPSTDEVD